MFSAGPETPSDDTTYQPQQNAKDQEFVDGPMFALEWLESNFEYQEDTHISRETLFQEYSYHCQRHGLEPLNSASFGKLIRSQFPNVSTRRLGTRGNSKYHYHGIRPKFDQMPSVTASTKGSRKSLTVNGKNGESKPVSQSKLMTAISNIPTLKIEPPDSWLEEALNKFMAPPLTNLPLLGVDPMTFSSFSMSYREHSKENLKSALTGDFQKLARDIITYWRHKVDTQMLALLQLEAVQKYVTEWDSFVYQCTLSFCIPDLLQKGDDEHIVHFIKYLEHCPPVLRESLENYPTELINEKIRTIGDLTRMSKQYQKLNYLAVRLGDTMQGDICEAMSTCWRDIDYEAAIIQSFSVCPNVHDVLRVVHEAVLQKLTSRAPLGRWAEWIYGVMEEFVSSELTSFEAYQNLANQFALRWSFISLLLLRDIYERYSREVFDVFNNLQMFVEEYLRFMIECKLEERKKAVDYHQPVEWSSHVSEMQYHGQDIYHIGQTSLYGQHQNLSSVSQTTSPHPHALYNEDAQKGEE